MKKRKRKLGFKTLGVLGAEAGCGVTHFCILLANYLKAVYGKKIAVVELDFGKNDFLEIQKIYEGTWTREGLPREFDIFGVSYHRNASLEELAIIFNKKYDCIILDFGSLEESNTQEWLKCSRKLLCVNLCHWKNARMIVKMEAISQMTGSEQFYYMGQFSTREETKRMRREGYKKFYSIPFEPDPFSLHLEQLSVLEEIL